MLKLEAYKTRDGVLHETHQQAEKHAKKNYDDAMTALKNSIAHDLRLTMNEAYKVACWIEEQKEHLVELIDLEDDYKRITKPVQEEDEQE